MKHQLFSNTLLVLLAGASLMLLSGCKFGANHILNPLGYNYVLAQVSTPSSSKNVALTGFHDVQAITYPHVKKAGLGSTLSSFIDQYGQTLPQSQPPSYFLFRAGLASFPDGSVLVVNFAIANDKNTPRATLISYVAGNQQPTTYEQAQAIAESYLPDDTSQSTQVQAFNDDADKCLAKGYNSPTLSTVFPLQDFLGGSGDKQAKPGDAIVSFFPHVGRSINSDNKEDAIYSIDQQGVVSSVLITLGARSAC